ncbi:MAG: peptide-N(4)-(N-acetyl-beta-glucosaminyl)asparagine amidase [Acidobacteriota bacterium]|nr:peptide-N(4)-(N-acetyl-beta-glucosaminyl)asparagine amidase [Acidobacteriota bacterium]
MLLNVLSPGRNRMMFSAAALLAFSSAAALAQVVVVPSTPQVGSSNPATADPLVPRPPTQPCIVPLLQEQAFADFSAKPISYTPPAACPGPWAKVVFTADFTVTAGRQFDRTASFYLDHANIYYGTTAEPRAKLSPSWHVERDVTDLTAIFEAPQTGQADLGNFVGVSGGVTYNGIIYANAALEFYPASWRAPAPRTPDVVVPVEGSGGDAGTLNTTGDRITQVLNLPRNVERVVLDVIAQSQSNDEQWFLCAPSDHAGNLQTCGNTAFRETEVFIDGQPAGVAPVYPWIYTGGIDPYLWEPIPGVQTLNFKPYRVDLTPFAGVLADGGTHTVSVGVFNANSYFLATANLLAYTDHGRQQVTGGLLSNTLSAEPAPVVTENIAVDAKGTTYTGTASVTSNRRFAIRGYVDTSHGRVETTVEQRVDFANNQQFNVGPATDVQNAQQTSTVDSRVSTQDGFLVNTVEQHFSYPITVDYAYLLKPDGSASQAVTVDQKYRVNESKNLNGFTYFKSKVSNVVNAADTLNFTASGSYSPSDSKTTQTYRATNSLGYCYSRTLKAAAKVLTSVTDGQGCEREDEGGEGQR